MARDRKPQDPADHEAGKEPTANGKSFKPDVGKFTSIAVGESHVGFFMGCKYQTIIDTRARDRREKQVMVIKLRDTETDEVKKIACATMLERAWEDVADEYGDGDHDKAVNNLRGRRIAINRGADERTRTTGNVIGTYEIIVFD